MSDYDAQPGRARPQQELSPQQVEADAVDLHAGLLGVAGIVAGARTVGETLRNIAEFAVRAIPGADAAGVTLIKSYARTPPGETWPITASFVEESTQSSTRTWARDRVSHVWSRGGPSSADRSEVIRAGRGSVAMWRGWVCIQRWHCR